jgi:hypothetical protein
LPAIIEAAALFFHLGGVGVSDKRVVRVWSVAFGEWFAGLPTPGGVVGGVGLLPRSFVGYNVHDWSFRLVQIRLQLEVSAC